MVLYLATLLGPRLPILLVIVDVVTEDAWLQMSHAAFSAAEVDLEHSFT
jgi:hypothetical protein